MRQLLVATLLLSLSLVWADGEEKATEDTEQTELPAFTPPPRPPGDVYFTEDFQDPDAVWSRWVKSQAKKDDADDGVGLYDGHWSLEELTAEGARAGDVGLVMKESAKHYAISAKLDRPFVFDDPNMEAFLAQYEVNFQEGMNCGGAYIKLIADSEDLDLEKFQEKTPYSIMFGPDKCGLSSKVHMIIRFKNPVTGEIEEKHSKQSTESMDFFTDKKTHLFTLLIRADGVYHVMLNQKPFVTGNLLEDLTPPINPPQEIDDPDDKMPDDWDEREKIPDPDAVKPDDWDEDAPAKIPDPDAVKPEGWLDDGPEFIPDPSVEQPEDWDEEEDGEWEPPTIPNPACEDYGCGEWKPPMIANPNYKGKWKPELIDNPNYMGKWEPRRIPNPAYFEDKTPFVHLLPISAVGFELWSMTSSVFFDNIIIASELALANSYATHGWILKFESERKVGGAMSMGPFLDWFVTTANEYPLLWAVYALAIVSPFALIAACCVKSKPDDAARRKKTDEPTPDAPQTEPKEGEGTQNGADKPEESFVAAADDEEEEVMEEAPPTASSEGETGEGSQGEGEGEGSQGEGEGSQGEGEGSQGEEEGSQPEGSQGEGSQGEEGGAEVAVEEQKTTARRSARKKAKARRED